jgi:hypothetical protein
MTPCSAIQPSMPIAPKLVADDGAAWNRVPGMDPLFDQVVANHPLIAFHQLQ